MAELNPQQRARIGRLWAEKQRLNPNMPNRGISGSATYPNKGLGNDPAVLSQARLHGRNRRQNLSPAPWRVSDPITWNTQYKSRDSHRAISLHPLQRRRRRALRHVKRPESVEESGRCSGVFKSQHGAERVATEGERQALPAEGVKESKNAEDTDKPPIKTEGSQTSRRSF